MFKTLLKLTFIISLIQSFTARGPARGNTSIKARTGTLKPLLIPQQECKNIEEPIRALQSLAGNKKNSINAETLQNCMLSGVAGQYRTYNVELHHEGHVCSLEFSVETGNRSGNRLIVRNDNQVKTELKNCFVEQKVVVDQIEEQQIEDEETQESQIVENQDEEYMDDFEEYVPEEEQQQEQKQEETKKEVPVAPVDENMYLDEVFNDDEFYANEHVDIDEVPAKIEVAQEDNKAIECDSDDIKRGQDVLSSAYLNNYSTEAKFDVVSCKRMLNPSKDFKTEVLTVKFDETVCNFEYKTKKFTNNKLFSTNEELKEQLDECRNRNELKKLEKDLIARKKKADKKKRNRQNRAIRNAAEKAQNQASEESVEEEDLNTDMLYENEDEYLFNKQESMVQEVEEEDLDTSSLYKGEEEYLSKNHHEMVYECDAEDSKNVSEGFMKAYKKYRNTDDNIKVVKCYTGKNTVDYRNRVLVVKYNNSACEFDFKFDTLVNGVKVNKNLESFTSEVDRCVAQEKQIRDEKDALVKQNKKDKKKRYLQRKAEEKRNQQSEDLAENKDFDEEQIEEPVVEDVVQNVVADQLEEEEEVTLNTQNVTSEPEACDAQDFKDVSEGFRTAYAKLYRDERLQIKIAECFKGDKNVSYRNRKLSLEFNNSECAFDFRYDSFTNGVVVRSSSNEKYFVEEMDRCHAEELRVRAELAEAKKIREKAKKKQKKAEAKNKIAAKLTATDESAEEEVNTHEHMTGAYENNDWTSATELFEKLVIAKLFRGKIIYKQNIESVSTQVVSGVNYSVVLSFNGERCHLQVYYSISDKKYYIYHDQVAAGKLNNENMIATLPHHPFTARNCADVYGSDEIKEAIKSSYL